MANEHRSSTFQPIIVMLYISGLYFPFSRPFQSLSVLNACFAFCNFLLGVTSTILLISKSLKVMISYWKSDVSIWLFGEFWMFCNLLFVAVFFSISASRHWPTFLQSLDEYHKKYPAGETSTNFIKVAKVLFSGCLCVLLYSLIVFFSACLAFFDYDQVLTVFMESGNETVVNVPGGALIQSRLWLWLTWYYIYIYLLVPATFYVFVWSSLYCQARRFNREFTDHIFDNSADPCRDLEHFRLRHQFLCKLVAKANAILSHLMCSIYTEGLPLLMLCLRSLLYGEMNLFTTFALVFTVTYLLGQLVIFTLMGATFCNRVR